MPFSDDAGAHKAVETGCQEEEHDDDEEEGGDINGEEEHLLLTSVNAEKPSARTAASHSYYCGSRFTVPLLLLVWTLTALLFYQLGRWMSQVHMQSLNNASLQQPSATLEPILTDNSSAWVVPEESNEVKIENKNENNVVSSTDEPDNTEPSAHVVDDLENTSDPLEADTDDESNDPRYSSHLPYGEQHKQYRRVCAPVHSSELCLTLRFPFAVEPQNPNFDYPHPVDERMYELEPSMYTVDGEELLACRNATVGTLDEKVMACLDNFALTRKDPSKSVVARSGLYGVLLSEEQGRRMDEYFDKHVILVLGASPAPAVTECLSALFGRCKPGGIKPVSKLCEGHSLLRDRELGNINTYASLPDDKTYLGVMGYYPNDNYHGRYHSLSDKDIPELVKSPDFQRPNPSIKRKLSIIVEHPIAHVQNQNMMMEQWDVIETIQHGFPQQIMNIYSPEGRKILSDAGWEPGYVIAFDGIPQFNPTKTGGFDWSQKELMNEEKFIANNGYTGWMKDYGTKCRGPLPPQSKLKQVNALARQGYQDAGLDPKFYGRTWEFANQFWFAVKGWTPSKGLDCTHAKQNGTGLSCVHKYVLQLMVDDHYESMER